MHTEIINDDFVIVNELKTHSTSISIDSLSQLYYPEYEYDIRTERYDGTFPNWCWSNNKPIEYLKELIKNINQ